MLVNYQSVKLEMGLSAVYSLTFDFTSNIRLPVKNGTHSISLRTETRGKKVEAQLLIIVNANRIYIALHSTCLY